MKTYRGMWGTAPLEIMEALGGGETHHRQCTIFGQGHSYADFIRRVVAVGAFPHDSRTKNPYAQAAREFSWSTGKDATGSRREIDAAAEAAPMPCAGSLHGNRDPVVVLPMGLLGAHLVPEKPGRSPAYYTLVQLLVRDGAVGFEVRRPPVLRYGREVHPEVVLGTVYPEGADGDRTWVAVFPGDQQRTSSDHPDRDAALRVLLAHHTEGTDQ